MDDKKTVAVDHLKTHVTYPASTEQIMQACNGWTDVDPALIEEGKMKMTGYTGKTWNSADEVLAALGWSGGTMGAGM